MKEITVQECQKLEQRYSVAIASRDGPVRLAHLVDEDDADSRWPNRMIEERDCSQISKKTAAAVGAVEETVLDLSTYTVGNAGEQTGFRTVSVHLKSRGLDRLLAIQRRKEKSSADTSSLASAALREFLHLAEKHGIDPTTGPLLGLDPELANSDERRLLIQEGFSYAIQLGDGHIFTHVAQPLTEAPDDLGPCSVRIVFELQHPDSSQARIVPVRDLRDERSASAGRFREYLVRIPMEEGEPLYFVARPALPPGVDEIEKFREAGRLARKAAERTLQSPGDALRAHQFHHPNDGRYCTVLRLVDFARGCE